MDAWAELLSRLPQTRLLLKGLPFTDASTRSFYQARFSERGIASDRITLLGGVPDRASHLAHYRERSILRSIHSPVMALRRPARRFGWEYLL